MNENWNYNIGVNVTRRCNMKCKFCYYKTLKYSINNETDESFFDIDESIFFSFIDQFEKINHLYLTGGEPLLHPRLKTLIDGVKHKTKRVYLCTNGMLIDQNWCDYISANRISLLLSLKNNSKNTVEKINYIHSQFIPIELYVVLNKDALSIIKNIPFNYPWVSKVRLLFETSSDPQKKCVSPKEWFSLINIAFFYLQSIRERVEIEIGYLRKSNPLAHKKDKCAVKRIILEYDGKIYPCPLLVENGNGPTDLSNLSSCSPTYCPVIRDVDTRDYEQICPFNIVRLNATQ